MKTLILSPIGNYLTNETICQSIQACFRICFQQRLSELLQNVCFQVLVEIIHHLFTRYKLKI